MNIIPYFRCKAFNYIYPFWDIYLPISAADLSYTGFPKKKDTVTLSRSIDMLEIGLYLKAVWFKSISPESHIHVQRQVFGLALTMLTALQAYLNTEYIIMIV